VWCIVTCPYDSLLFAACEDGAVRIFRYGDSDDRLVYVKSIIISGNMKAKKVRALSLALHPSKTHKQLFVGGSDGVIRCFDWSTGYCMFRMTGDILPSSSPRGHKGGSSNQKEPEPEVSSFAPQMWSLLLLADQSLLASGDSRGQLQLWDVELGVLVCSFKQHLGDVLALSASSDGERVFSAGLDGKVCCVERVGPDEWVHTYAHRAHTHDIHALAVRDSTLLSGGVDTKLCTYSTRDFAQVRPRWIPLLPANRLVQHSEDYSLLVLQQRHSLELWAMRPQDTASKPLELAVNMQLKGEGHVHCVALAPISASMLAVSSTAGTRMWRLSGSANPDPEKVSLPDVVTQFSRRALKDEFCHAMRFSFDETLFAAFCASSQCLALFRVQQTPAGVGVSLLHVFAALPPAQEPLAGAVRKVVFSRDGQFLAVCDCACGVHVYHIDRLKLHWSLPPSSSPVTDVEFQQDDSSAQAPLHLLVLSADNSLQMFDVLACNLSAGWGSNPTDPAGSRMAVPGRVRRMAAPLSGIALDPHSPHRLVLYCHSYAVLVDLSMDAQAAKEVPADDSNFALSPRFLKRQRTSLNRESKGAPKETESPEEEDEEEGEEADNEIQEKKEVVVPKEVKPLNYIVFNVYRNLIHVGCAANDTMVVIENPWTALMMALPATLDRKMYGT